MVEAPDRLLDAPAHVQAIEARLDALDEASFGEALKTPLEWSQRQLLDRHAPTRISVPSGLERTISYALDSETGEPLARTRLQALIDGGQESDAEVLSAARQSLARINEAIGAISDMATQIAAAAEEQTSVTGEISRNTENIRHVSQTLAAQAKEEAAQAAELKSLTERLEQEIGRFRL